MLLHAGSRLGPYEVQSALGAGGMGEVYLARDTRLDRTIALKVLSPEVASDPAFRTRFEREARLISSLSHPHICILHDIGRDNGVDYLVLEHLEGQTLAERLRADGTGLKLADLLRVSTEIADALDTAHRHGVVHRDLKPGNIMLTPSGAKLLDFGLAKQPAGAGAAGLASLATAADTATVKGTILGTLQYMAPEQIQGRPADARTDIFAFGVLVYEMMTGRKAFEGQTQASVIAKILEVDPPPMSAIATVSPPALDRLVQRCLAKSPEDRWQNARDVLLELQWIQQSGVTRPEASVGPKTSVRRPWLPWAVAATALLVGGLSWVVRPIRVAADRPVVRFDVPIPADMSLENWRGWPILSPDGRILAVPAAHNGKGLLVLRHLDDSSVVPLAGTEGAFGPFFSASGRSLAFYAAGKLRRIDLAGGSAVPLTDVGPGTLRGGSWNREGIILFAPRPDSGLFRIAESGGTAERVTTPSAGRGDINHVFPEFLPDGRSFLFTVRGREGGIYTGSLDSSDSKRILEDVTHGHYVEPGYLVFQRGRALLAVGFDARRREVSSAPFPIADQVFPSQYSATAGGDLAYRFDGTISAQLTWFARDGRRLGSVGSPGPYRQIALSPTGRRVVIQAGDLVSGGSQGDLFLLDFATGVRSRLTNDPALHTDPAWSPDERKLAFTTNRTGRGAAFVKDLTTGEEKPLFDFPTAVVVDEWTPDGKFLIFRSSGRNIQALPLEPSGPPRMVLNAPSSIQDQSHVSPDGRWITYNSDESGTWEVYAASFPDLTGKRQISIDGGMQPLWRRDGQELFYLSPQGQLMAVDVHVSESTSIETGAPRALFRTGLNPSVQVGEYGVAPDGKRFLFMEPVGDRNPPISLLLNWQAKPR
jgi:Tol biopolymer transport system component